MLFFVNTSLRVSLASVPSRRDDVSMMYIISEMPNNQSPDLDGVFPTPSARSPREAVPHMPVA